MPQQPDASFAPDVDVDDSKKYIGELLEIVEQESISQWKKPGEMTMVHKWRLFDAEDGVAVINQATGEPYEQWQFVKDQTYHNKTTGEIAEARQIANTLLGREITDDDVRRMIAEGWDQDLIGKRAMMDLEWYTNQKGYQRLKILRIKPYKRPAAAAGRSARGRRLDEDDDE